MDIAEQLQQQLIDATRSNRGLQIIGNDTKSFYGRKIDESTTDSLAITEHRGITDYQPTELTLTARAGSSLAEIIQSLAEQKQMLAFEPPTFEGKASLGGCIATALAGPRRPWAGSVRDALTGVRVLTGDGRDVRFGGSVMKNVAGYDLFRPMAGALGTLGVMLDITLRVIPAPEAEQSFSMQIESTEMQELMHDWRLASMPLSALSYTENTLRVRLSGSAGLLDASISRLPVEMTELSAEYWQELNEHRLSFFVGSDPLYRLVLPVDADCGTMQGETLIDWAGALCWLKSSSSFSEVRDAAKAAGGTATIYRNSHDEDEVFMPLPDPLLDLHKRIKQVMDPAGILNPGKLYSEL